MLADQNAVYNRVLTRTDIAKNFAASASADAIIFPHPSAGRISTFTGGIIWVAAIIAVFIAVAVIAAVAAARAAAA